MSAMKENPENHINAILAARSEDGASADPTPDPHSRINVFSTQTCSIVTEKSLKHVNFLLRAAFDMATVIK